LTNFDPNREKRENKVRIISTSQPESTKELRFLLKIKSDLSPRSSAGKAAKKRTNLAQIFLTFNTFMPFLNVFSQLPIEIVAKSFARNVFFITVLHKRF